VECTKVHHQELLRENTSIFLLPDAINSFISGFPTTEKIPLFFLFFFVPSPDPLDDCGSQETADRKQFLYWFPTTVVRSGKRCS
jgi:hypothetical protein